MSYAEGWALYAESIGKELGLFTDPYQWYGRLSDEMLRAMRLVVDTGLHSKGWTREQAIRYMLDNSSLAESDVTAEVERYIVWPGQALGYKLGQLHITALRAKAQSAAGRDIRRARVPQPGAARRRRADGRADREDRSLDRRRRSSATLLVVAVAQGLDLDDDAALEAHAAHELVRPEVVDPGLDRHFDVVSRRRSTAGRWSR